MKADGYEDTEPIELPCLRTKAMKAGDEFIALFHDVDLENKKSPTGKEMKIAIVTDFLDNIKKSVVLPSAISKHFEAIRGKVVKCRKGEEVSNGEKKFCRWDVIPMRKKEKAK